MVLRFAWSNCDAVSVGQGLFFYKVDVGLRCLARSSRSSSDSTVQAMCWTDEAGDSVIPVPPDGGIVFTAATRFGHPCSLQLSALR